MGKIFREQRATMNAEREMEYGSCKSWEIACPPAE